MRVNRYNSVVLANYAITVALVLFGFIGVATGDTYVSGDANICESGGVWYYASSGPRTFEVYSEQCGNYAWGSSPTIREYLDSCAGLEQALINMGPNNTIEFTCGDTVTYPVEYCIPSIDIPLDAQSVTIGIRNETGDQFYEIPIGDLEREIGICLGNYYEVFESGNYYATHRFDWQNEQPNPDDPFVEPTPPSGAQDDPVSVTLAGQPVEVSVQEPLQVNFDDTSIIHALNAINDQVYEQGLNTRNELAQNNSDLISALDENHGEIKDKMDNQFGILTNILNKGSDTYGDSDTEINDLIQQAAQLEIEEQSYQVNNWNPSSDKECSYTIGTGIPYIGQISINLCDIPLIPNIRAMLLVFVTITQYLFFFFLAMQVFKVVK